jgi:hypothetical protein
MQHISIHFFISDSNPLGRHIPGVSDTFAASALCRYEAPGPMNHPELSGCSRFCLSIHKPGFPLGLLGNHMSPFKYSFLHYRFCA